MKKEIILTHFWVSGFGWEDTILIEEDFKELDKLGENEKDGIVFIGVQKLGNGKNHILKGYYR